MNSQNTIYDVGIYCRLSRDDKEGNTESMSISNQKEMLTAYVNERGWNLRDVFVDDGFTGTNFDRPDFQRMLRAIEKGLINCVITKDLSRLGRDVSKSSYYVDSFFPEHGIRYIAVSEGQDSLDTLTQNNLMVPFYYAMNEVYPRDVSRKVRMVKKSNAQQGKFMGSHAPFGYVKSPDDKHKLIIDEPAAQIVRRIFSEFCSGVSARAICDRLNVEKINAPRFYLYKQGYGQKPKTSEHNSWTSSTILQMLQNQAYIGNMVQGKREVISFKTKKRREVDPSKWIIVENTHEPIIDRDIWNSVQAKRATGAHHIRRAKVPDGANVNGLFSGYVVCADCGWHLALVNGKSYRCSNYNNAGKRACSSHLIKEDTLKEFALSDIQHYATLARADRDKVRRRLIGELNKAKISESKLLENQIRDLEVRQKEYENALESLYLDKCSGRLPEAQFSIISKRLSGDTQDVSDKLKASYKALQAQQSVQSNVDEWLDRIEDCLDIKELNRSIVSELIDKIVVGARVEHEDKSITQEITIHYRFVGNIAADKRKDIA